MTVFIPDFKCIISFYFYVKNKFYEYRLMNIIYTFLNL